MGQDTIQTVSVDIGIDIAQALWAAMGEDDDMANNYVDYALCHALTHLVEEGFGRVLPRKAYLKLIYNLEVARDRLDASADEQAERWRAAVDTPF